jgi:hypothetical protein
MLLKPNKRIITEYQALLSLSISHKKINPINKPRKIGNARPSNAMIHELVGFIYGAKQESKYRTAVIILSTTRVRLVIIRSRDGIDAIYEL